MTTTQSQRHELDRLIPNGWRRIHTKADGTIVLRKTVRHRGHSGVGVSLPGPFWTHVGRTSGHTSESIREIRPDGEVVNPTASSDHKAKLVAGGFFVGLLGGPIGALIGLVFGAVMAYSARGNRIRNLVIAYGILLGIAFPPLLVVLAIALAVWTWKRNKNERENKIAACAACRGEHDGSALLQPSDAPLCKSHWQQRRRIENLESKLLG